MVNRKGSRTHRADCSVHDLNNPRISNIYELWNSSHAYTESVNMEHADGDRWRYSVIQPAAAVRDLGVLLDQELSMTEHTARVMSSCFYQMHRLRQIGRPVGQELVAQLVHSFVLSRLDYGNSVLAGLPNSAIMPLQRVQNATAWLILNLRMNEHVT